MNPIKIELTSIFNKLLNVTLFSVPSIPVLKFRLFIFPSKVVKVIAIMGKFHELKNVGIEMATKIYKTTGMQNREVAIGAAAMGVQRRTEDDSKYYPSCCKFYY